MSISRVLRSQIPALVAAFLASCRQAPLVAVDGTGQIPAVDFGRVIVGESSTAPFVVENVAGNAFHIIAAPGIAGSDPGDFALVAVPPATVQQGQSVTGEISFSPHDAGSRDGQLTIATDSRGRPLVSGNLTGIGVPPESVDLSAFPPALDFGQVEVRTTATLPLQITNDGTDAAPLRPFQITGANAADFDFAAEGDAGAGLSPLLAGASLRLSVTFTPSVLGMESAALQVQACRLCAPLSIPLSGIGFTPGLNFVPPALSFSAGRGLSQTQPIKLVNNGNASTTLTGIAIVDGGLQFSVNFGSKSQVPLDVGGSFSFTVTYAPPLAETVGELDQASLTPQTVGGNVVSTPAPLTGTVALNCQLSAPTSLFFGYAVPPYYEPAQVLTISNAGVDECAVSQFAFAPGSDPAFEFQTPPPASLMIPGNGSNTLSLTFSPGDASDPWLRQGTLTMQTGEPALRSISVALSGYTQDTPYPKGSPWPKRCHDNGNSCLSDVDTSQTGPRLRWRTAIATYPASYGSDFTYYWQSPAIGGDGTIYQLGVDGSLYAIDPNGETLWSSQATPLQNLGWPYDAVAPTVSASGQVMVTPLPNLGAGANQGTDQYFGFAADGGVGLWASATPADSVDDGPALRPDGVAMFALGEGNSSPPAVTGIASYLGGEALPLFACPACFGTGVIATDGTSYWTSLTNQGSPQVIQILPDGGPGYSITLVVACGGVAVPLGAPLLKGSELYLSGWEGLGDGGIFSGVGVFNVDNGLELEWQYCNYNDFEGGIVALVPDGGVLLSVEYGNTGEVPDVDWEPTGYGFAWVDSPGTLRWETRMPPSPIFPGFDPRHSQFPAVGAEGTVYFTSDFAPLTALSAADGTVLWQFDGGPAGTSAPAIGADGTIYFQDIEGYLNAIR